MVRAEPTLLRRSLGLVQLLPPWLPAGLDSCSPVFSRNCLRMLQLELCSASQPRHTGSGWRLRWARPQLSPFRFPAPALREGDMGETQPHYVLLWPEDWSSHPGSGCRSQRNHQPSLAEK